MERLPETARKTIYSQFEVFIPTVWNYTNVSGIKMYNWAFRARVLEAKTTSWALKSKPMRTQFNRIKDRSARTPWPYVPRIGFGNFTWDFHQRDQMLVKPGMASGRTQEGRSFGSVTTGNQYRTILCSSDPIQKSSAPSYEKQLVINC